MTRTTYQEARPTSLQVRLAALPLQRDTDGTWPEPQNTPW
jgi:hypothetical protein